ncbi:XdhC family protein [Colwelliaceae bacterium BS250]
MQLTDKHVIEQANAWMQNNKTIWLCTILNTYGSAPRPIGSLFITDGEQRCGSISGGCLEDAFVTMLNNGEFQQSSDIFTYGNHAIEQDIVRELPCGGTIRLLVECFISNQENQHHLTSLLELANKQQPFTRTINLQQQSKCLNKISGENIPAIYESTDVVVLAYAQVFSLLLVGIGQVTEHIAQLGLMAGFEVKLCDMRKELASSWRFTKENGGVDVDWMSPDLFVEKYSNKRSAVLALAHDPRIDDPALMSVFDTDSFYIGAMGSHKTSANRSERLQRICEITPEQLTRLHAPIGLHIGSKTPVEIAISTLADIIRVKNGIAKGKV